MLKTNKQALSRCCALGHRNKADRAGEASLAFSCHGAALASWEGERDTVWVTSKAAFQQRLHSGGASLVAELVKNLPATQETGFDAWVGKILWRRKWQPSPVFSPRKSHGQRSLVGCSPWTHKSWMWLSD